MLTHKIPVVRIATAGGDMGTGIRSLGFYLPEREVSNREIAKTVDTSDEWIVQHTGIHSRHLASDQEACSDLAVKAAQQALERGKVRADELDMIIVATVTPDYINFPATANLVQARLGAEKAGAFDLVVGCTGFVYALGVGRSMVMGGGFRKVLIIGSEKLSQITNWQDRSTCILFGDGAGACLLEETNQETSDVLDVALFSKNSGQELLCIPRGGTRHPYREGDRVDDGLYLRMDGRAVYNFAVEAGIETASLLLDRNGLTIDEIDWVVPHQANVRIIKAMAKWTNIPAEKFFVCLEHCANTSSASIPIALCEMERQNLLKKGQLVLLIGFGAGPSYGGALLRW